MSFLPWQGRYEDKKMNIVDCYRRLGLKSGANLAEVKASYRKLARLYHPDVNPSDRDASQKFIVVTEAYKLLLSVAPPETKSQQQSPPQSSPTPTPTPTAKTPTPSAKTQGRSSGETKVRATRKQASVENNPQQSQFELQLKQKSYLQLQQLLKHQRFPRAIALVEGLAQRLPEDKEVRQWQAIAYQRWGRYLIGEGKLDKARSYLKKALKTDPYNRTLGMEVARDFSCLEEFIRQ